MSDKERSTEHIPVLAGILAEQITVPTDGVMVDATLGHGGHSSLFGSKMSPGGTIIGLDVDEKSLTRAQLELSDLECRVVLIRENFAQIEEILAEQGVEGADFILADLGFCSAQLMDPDRGMSFQENARLDMRLDDRLPTTAADIVNRTDEKDLADIIYRYGEERASRRIARFIVERRKAGPISTTGQLAAIICKALNQPPRGRRFKIHPATRTFQALRIAVNDELGNLEKLLNNAPKVLKKHGKIAIISFHSLEDRIVKNDFKAKADQGVYRIVNKKPLTADRAEIRDNPRSRSAKLRIAERL
ncbi:Ribosomal RNA small subunit methyltransferase H [Anaerohalosphaera lusitana]|uniref:Ribosomal RNA small subunit methyltransferase H n=1 Tax=Anaerohalosphaera lusitana TaxID=1936003 RepID=A0A1U9NR69_9BACT|nr:16S rRNA (cytosine(1402)-N(4))-methyltransferase RsmH [Anaerohalosphaera lusitana]AQT70120.1 Ribosomal RNA small subunit methyltransferase H [Anaerohalosphaera lusitana]